MAFTEDKLAALLCDGVPDQVYVFRFTDGTQEELTECWLSTDEDGCWCFGTIVRTAPGS